MMLSGVISLIGIEDGIGYEEIYRLTSSSTSPSTPSSSNTNGAVPSGWYSTPQSVSRSYPYQWVCKRSKVDGDWGAWSTPVEYNRFVEDAIIYESCYKATQYNSIPSTPTSSNVDGSVPSGWYSTPPDISAINAYVWESQRKKSKGLWGSWSTPKLKNRWANDGAQGGKGARMRMREWTSGTEYLQGKDGEDFYDIVLYNSKLYLCLKSHTASSSNNPVTSINNYLGYWEMAQDWVFVATRLLLAEKIKASQIDADGIVAKDVNVSGSITANRMYIPFTRYTPDDYPLIWNPEEHSCNISVVGSEEELESAMIVLPVSSYLPGITLTIYTDFTSLLQKPVYISTVQGDYFRKQYPFYQLPILQFTEVTSVLVGDGQYQWVIHDPVINNFKASI